MENKNYIAVVQCQIVKQRCSGYFCEKSFNERSGLFANYAKDKPFRTIYLTCGGCCGRAVLRKLADLVRSIKRKEKMEKDNIVVHLSTCITKESYHGPKCPHLDYLKDIIIDKAGLELVEGTRISELSEKRRNDGTYKQ